MKEKALKAFGVRETVSGDFLAVSAREEEMRNLAVLLNRSSCKKESYEFMEVSLHRSRSTAHYNRCLWAVVGSYGNACNIYRTKHEALANAIEASFECVHYTVCKVYVYSSSYTESYERAKYNK